MLATVDTLKANKFTVFIKRQFGVGYVIAAVCISQKRLRAISRPFDTAANPFRRPDHHCLFGVDKDLGAKAAADIGRHHPEFVLRRDGHECRKNEPCDVGILSGVIERKALGGRIVFADRRARLDCVRRDAVVDEV